MENELDKSIKKVARKNKKDDKDIAIPISYLETTDHILEQVYNATDATRATHAQDTEFIVFDKQTKLTTKKQRFVYNDREYKPIVDELLETGALLLPSDIEEYGSTEKLTKDIADFLFSYFEPPKFFEKFLPYIVLFYWVYDKFPFVPYLHFVGLTGTGKTTAQEVLGSICYKPIDASGSITLSPIFRTASTWRGTLLLDEFDADGDSYKEMLSFLKSGTGNKAVLRTEGDSRREVKVYLIKSPKIFTSEKPINNAGLQSRTIVVQMSKNKRRVPLFRLPHFLQESQILRNKLLLWRLHNLNNIELEKIEFGFPELEIFDRRVQQVITPIYYLSNVESKEEIKEFAEKQQEDTLRERRESLEGQIFQILADSGFAELQLKFIAEKINVDRATRPVSEKKIANILRRVMGFEIERIGHENIRMVILLGKEPKIEELKQYFGIDGIPVAQVAQVAQVAIDGLDYYDNIKSATDKKEENV